MPKALQAALGLAARGIRVFPCKQDKTPYTEHGFKDASCGNALIAEWWTSWPGALIGVPTGSVAGLDVLDLDAKHNEARVWWRDNCRRFPRTAQDALRRVPPPVPAQRHGDLHRGEDRVGRRYPRQWRVRHMVAGGGPSGDLGRTAGPVADVAP
jgi:hypothetical protein